jgi:exodeoxyribonuclease V alpha subunit
LVRLNSLTILEGVLDRIVYLNEEDNYTVAKLQVDERRELITIVGNLISVSPGETLRLEGEWVRNQRFGEQFRVKSCLSKVPATLTGIEKYLSSGLIRGIGPVLARRLVQKFGLETLNVIEGDPQKLLEVEDIGSGRLAQIRKAWEEQKEIREVMIFLQGIGVSSTYAVKIYKAYKERAISVVKENPYRLAMDISGIGFKTADRIAQSLGIDPNSQVRAEAGILYTLSKLTDEGHVCYPQASLEEKVSSSLNIDTKIVERALAALDREGKIVLKEEDEPTKAYLKPLYTAEEGVAQKLTGLVNFPKPQLLMDVEEAIEWVQNKGQIELADKQREAISKAIGSKVLIITGGPGTGKTTLIKSIIQIAERQGQKLVLASPTGRAAKRLSEVTGREAKTIHRLLEYSPKEGKFNRDEGNPLKTDIVIVDEASMVDILLAHHLLKAIPLPATLILVGDADQLPSVGPGNFLRDVINSQAVEVVTLEYVFRQARQSQIVVNAHKVNQGQFPSISDSKDFYFIERKDPQEVLEVIKELCARRIPRVFGVSLGDIQVLTPMHKGVVGVSNLNRELQGLLNPIPGEIWGEGSILRRNDKVMQIKNNYDKEVFNGDIGTISRINLEDQEVRVRFEDKEITYDFSELDELTLAYAISVHKSQGSEYPAVVMPILTQHFIMLQRNLLYTAITRAKKLLILVGTKQALAIAVKNNKVLGRYTGLKAKLKHILSP